MANEKKKDKEIQNFLKHFYKEPPLVRLEAKAAVRGGLNEVYRHRWKNLLPEEVFWYGDMISSYPFEAAQSLPLGEYEVSNTKDFWKKIKSFFIDLNGLFVIYLFRQKCK